MMDWRDDCFDGNLVPFISHLHVTILSINEISVIALVRQTISSPNSTKDQQPHLPATYVPKLYHVPRKQCGRDMGPPEQAMRHFCSFPISKISYIGTIFIFAKVINISGIRDLILKLEIGHFILGLLGQMFSGEGIRSALLTD